MTIKIRWIATLFFLVIYNLAFTQNVYRLDSEKSTLTISGTSTLHDWHMIAEEVICNTSIDNDANSKMKILDVQFKCESEKLLSEKKMMDNKAHKALKSEDYPMIEFGFTSLKSIRQESDQIGGEITGQLTLAGITKEIDVAFSGKIIDDRQFTVSVKLPMKMSDFDIKAPVFMFGAVSTGDEIVLNCEFTFKR